MIITKYLEFNVLNTDTSKINNVVKFKCQIYEKSGNYILYKDILRHQNSLKQSTLLTKTRSEVRGGGHKPWRQKGTGRARAGSKNSPLWKGGGVIFGPKPKKKIFKLNKKERNLILQTLLFNKREKIFIIEDLENKISQPKTKFFFSIFKTNPINWNRKSLLIVSNKTNSLKLSVRNLKKVQLLSANNLNTLSLLKAEQIFITSAALINIKNIYCE